MPTLGLGTWRSEPNAVGNAVQYALTQAGYLHIDCAAIYKNEAEIGSVFSKVFTSKAARENVFITSKLWNTEHNPKNVANACKRSLKDLKLDYLDLYLMHWGIAFEHGKNLEPIGKDGKIKREKVAIHETWFAMEELVKLGLVKSIGVANFTNMMLLDLISYAQILPVVNQVEVHPYNSQKGLRDFANDNNIATTAYSPLGTPGTADPTAPFLLGDEKVKAIALAHNKSAAQVLIRWSLQLGNIVIPKSTTAERIKENINVFDFELNEDQMTKLNGLNYNYRYVNPSKWWGVDYFN